MGRVSICGENDVSCFDGASGCVEVPFALDAQYQFNRRVGLEIDGFRVEQRPDHMCHKFVWPYSCRSFIYKCADTPLLHSKRAQLSWIRDNLDCGSDLWILALEAIHLGKDLVEALFGPKSPHGNEGAVLAGYIAVGNV